MTKKIKFFDSIRFSGDVEFLKFRLIELDPYVDYFIIADFNHVDSELSFIKNKNLFDEWNHKISHIFVDEDSFLSKIKDEFIRLNPYFEDILMISNVNEIPNLNYKDEILQRLIFGPIKLEHQNFIWNIDYIDTVRRRGTMVFSFTSILQSKHTMSSLLRTKFTSNVIGSVLYSNGWKFLNFGDYDPNYETIIKELLPPTQIDPVRTYPLIKHNNKIELPKNLDLLPYFKIGRDEVKKHLFVQLRQDLESRQGLGFIQALSNKIENLLTNPVIDQPRWPKLKLDNMYYLFKSILSNKTAHSDNSNKHDQSPK